MMQLLAKYEKFINDRDWEKFHSPKNLAMALSVEASEIQEIFMWLKEEESYQLNPEKKQHLKDEIGDVFLYLLNLANKFNIDIIEAAAEKLIKNEDKYPIAKSKGNSFKYTELK